MNDNTNMPLENVATPDSSMTTATEHTTDHPVPFFIAFSGKKQVGKDTSADYAVDLLVAAGNKVAVTAFAEVLKRKLAIDILGLPEKMVYGTDKDKNQFTYIMWDNMAMEIREKYSTGTVYRSRVPSYPIEPFPEPRTGPMTAREVLQVIGTDIFREMFEQNIWANSPFRRDWSDYDIVILTDCRFPNEKRVTEEHGGVTIRLERETGLKDEHASETALDGAEFEHKFINDGDIESLYDYVDSKLVELNLI